MARFESVRAFAIHVFTACGTALALLAMILATGGHWAAMFFCLGAAALVDGLDGPLARTFNIGEVLPRWSGEALDLVVDYITYVFVPAYAVVASGLLPHVVALLCGIVICVTGALYFADRKMKTADNYFRGFPAVWNVVAFYLFILEPPPWVAAAVIAALAGLTFVPFRFVHPFRVRRWRALNVALLGLWIVLAFVAVVANLAPGPSITVPLSVIAVYYLLVGLWRRPV